eukprot:s961_g3.t1
MYQASAAQDKSALEKDPSIEKDHLEAELAKLKAQIATRQAEVEAIQAQADAAKASGVLDPMGFQTGVKALEAADVEALGAQWKEQGHKAVEDAQARAAAELDRLLSRFMELVQQVQDSEAFQSASTQLQSATEQGMATASSALAQASSQANAALQQGMTSASQAAAQARDVMEKRG